MGRGVWDGVGWTAADERTVGGGGSEKTEQESGGTQAISQVKEPRVAHDTPPLF